jgi:diadenosine tetraphosphatase ApaH/serine/threonine PP2A family protein phosphatase
VQDLTRIAVFGGVYNNHLALRAVLADARACGAERVFNLGDVGGFGPHPDRSVEIVRDSDVASVLGNYDESVGNALPDCGCGYTDPEDNHYARLSYDYTLRNTSEVNRKWLRELPRSARVELGGLTLHMAHGSPRRINEFLWESTTPEPFIRRLLGACEADVLLVTHTGLHWHRFLADEPARGVVNVGAIGRPANDGDPAVWYALLTAPPAQGVPPGVEMRRVAYDHERLAREMEAEGLPPEFATTIRTGWWTTCLEVLPARERRDGRY